MNPSDHSRPKLASEANVDDLRALAQRYQMQLEAERTRLARDLHDDLTQKLTVLSLELSLLDGSVAAEHEPSRAKTREKIKELAQTVNAMIQSLRRIKTGLRPKVLDEFGLIAALELAADEFHRRTGTRCFFKPGLEEVNLPAAIATELFRMFQQIMANVAQHAAAKRVYIEVKRDGPLLLLRVTDDGRGMTREQAAHRASLGLLELRERARAIGGQVAAEGTLHKGTTVTIRVPCVESAALQKPA